MLALQPMGARTVRWAAFGGLPRTLPHESTTAVQADLRLPTLRAGGRVSEICQKNVQKKGLTIYHLTVNQ